MGICQQPKIITRRRTIFVSVGVLIVLLFAVVVVVVVLLFFLFIMTGTLEGHVGRNPQTKGIH